MYEPVKKALGTPRLSGTLSGYSVSIPITQHIYHQQRRYNCLRHFTFRHARSRALDGVMVIGDGGVVPGLG